MSRPVRCAGFIGLACACVVTPTSAQDEPDLGVSGYYKNLLLRSETFVGEPYTLDLNRLRLELKGRLAAGVRFDIQYDNEVLLGNHLRTSQFRQQKDQPPSQYWSAQANYVERSALYGVHRLYRAQLEMAFGDTDLRIGRQRIAWGTGRFWSPLDLLNPFSPVALEREERLGVDAALVEHKFGPATRLGAVYAPSHSPGENTRALQWHDNARGVDFSFTGGRFRGDDVIGVDLAGQIGQAGVRAELTRVRPREGKSFVRALAGIDYAFANTLTLSAELYRDGGGADNTAAYDFAALVNGSRLTLARRYLGLRASYEITPLLKLNTDVVLNLDDRSRLVAPGVAWSIRANLDASFAVRWFSGAAGSEYARMPDAAHLSLQRFF